MLYELYIEDKFNYLQNRIKESVNVLHELIHSLDYKNYILDYFLMVSMTYLNKFGII